MRRSAPNAGDASVAGSHRRWSDVRSATTSNDGNGLTGWKVVGEPFVDPAGGFSPPAALAVDQPGFIARPLSASRSDVRVEVRLDFTTDTAPGTTSVLTVSFASTPHVQTPAKPYRVRIDDLVTYSYP